MTSLAIVDDETKMRSLLRNLVTPHCPWIKLVGEADAVESGLALITEKQPDIVLLDVQMGDGDGFDLLEQLPAARPHIIFVTAYHQYTLQALRAGAVDYLEKPILKQELLQALERTQVLIEQQKQPSYEQLLKVLHADEENQRIAVPIGSGSKYLKVSEITHIQANGAYTWFHFASGRKPLLVSRMLADVNFSLEELGFIRVHRSFLVNTTNVEELLKVDGGVLKVTGGAQVPISKAYKQTALQVIQKGIKSI
ncbi:MAG: LytR/AlgR family response regulator transcription factor [Salibacteraceae bacterium]